MSAVVVTDAQRKDLNVAVLEYLQSRGHGDAAAAFARGARLSASFMFARRPL